MEEFSSSYGAKEIDNMQLFICRKSLRSISIEVKRGLKAKSIGVCKVTAVVLFPYPAVPGIFFKHDAGGSLTLIFIGNPDFSMASVPSPQETFISYIIYR